MRFFLCTFTYVCSTRINERVYVFLALRTYTYIKKMHHWKTALSMSLTYTRIYPLLICWLLASRLNQHRSNVILCTKIHFILSQCEMQVCRPSTEKHHTVKNYLKTGKFSTQRNTASFFITILWPRKHNGNIHLFVTKLMWVLFTLPYITCTYAMLYIQVCYTYARCICNTYSEFWFIYLRQTPSGPTLTVCLREIFISGWE